MNNFSLAIFSALSIMFAISGLSDRIIANARKRKNQLEAVKALLKQHYDALEVILEDPAASLELKTTLVWFSDVVSDHDIATQFVKNVCDAEFKRKSGGDENSFIADLNVLEKTRPDLHSKATVAVTSAFFVMVLLWPENAEKLAPLLSKLSANPRDGMVVAARAAKSKVSFAEDHYDIGNNALTA